MDELRDCYWSRRLDKPTWIPAIFHLWSRNADGDNVAIIEEKESGDIGEVDVQAIRFQPPI